MPKRSIEQELSYLFSGELTSVFLFCIVYLIYIKPETRFAPSSAIIYFPFFILNLILIQGALYWLNCLKKIQKKQDLETRIVAPIYKFLKVLDYMLMFAYIPIWLMTFRENNTNAMIGIGLWLFAFLELVNYFHYRLSYYTKNRLGLQVIKPLRLLITGKATKPQIAKEIILYNKKYRK
ncbi:Uncharacterised protein [Streptococcus constellatus]|uniref:Uncharacterized protein n=1 Tax=Streptococcus constellatus TaxID=76860 RepID=A0A564SMF6_STRCV|nr:hypothetical protein [Streptococcus constellatus]VUW96336.1 Uncharacterised protein [Streptococcus constellatus]VUX06168.1 Uncharacterised protein [Streptococcus gordonii]